jgi:hypothetical protein
METTIYIMLFLISFGISLWGAYNKGNKDGKKEMLNTLQKKNIISAETFVKISEILEK